MCNSSIQSDHVRKAQRLVLVLDDKKNNSYKIIDYPDPGDRRIEKDLAKEFNKKIWNLRGQELGSILNLCGNWCKDIDITAEIAQLQKPVLFSAAKHFWIVLEILGCWL